MNFLRRRPLPELRLLWPALLLCVAVWVFLKVLSEVLEGDTHALDAWILHLLRTQQDAPQPIGPVWLQEAIRDLTAMGSPAVLVLMAGMVWGYLVLGGHWAMAWLTLAATGGGVIVAMGLKTLISRDRPDALFHATVASGYSFPSAHAMMSAVVYLTLGALVARLAPRLRLRVFVMACAVTLTGLVGISRIYLGVHWATDVLAGWSAGLAWALLCWMLAHHLGLGREDAS